MNKLIVNHLGRHFVTNDTNTMINELEVMHPAAKSQDGECGDGTNLVVSLAGELLQKSEDLLKEGIHANDILKGYELAKEKVLEKLETCRVWSCPNVRSKEELTKCVKTAL